MGKKRQISICADDFGMAPAVDAAVLRLAEAGRLSGTSCLVDGAHFAMGAPQLREASIQKGLHLNFTEAGPEGPCYVLPLRRLIPAAYLQRLDPRRVRESIARQLDAYEAGLKQAPDYIDGHQHVHQLPVIRDALLDELGRRYSARMPWLRFTGGGRLDARFSLQERFKAGVIAALGSRALFQAAIARGITLNPGFVGVYDFQGGVERYAGLMQRWLAVMRHGDSLMCHPAIEPVPGDMLGGQRWAEYQVLAGDQLPEWLDRHGLRLA